MRATLIAAVLLLAGCGEAKKQFDDGFKQQFEQSFATSCAKGAADQGVPADKMEKVREMCACTAKTLVSKYGVTELTAMGTGANKEAIEAAAQGCMAR